MKRSILALGMALVMILSGCAQKKEVITIAKQTGISSAPLVIADKLGFIEKNLPEGQKYEFTVVTGGGAGVREAIVTGGVEFGLMGLPPIIVGIDKNMPLEPIVGMGYGDFSFLTRNENIRTIEDLSEEDKIALLQFGSSQHMQLSMIADKVFKEPTKFDDNIVVMPEDVALAALEMGKEVNSYYAPQPYTYYASQFDGVHTVFKTSDYLGEISSLALVGSKEFNKKNKNIVNALKLSIEEGVEYMNNYPEESIAILAEEFETTEEELSEILRDFIPNTVIKGYEQYREYMYQNEMINNEGKKLEEVIFK